MTTDKIEIHALSTADDYGFKAYIQWYIQTVSPRYRYPNEHGINPAFQRIENVTAKLHVNEKRLFVLRSDFVLATGVKNSEQQHGYQGLKETFLPSQYPYLNWYDRYGHPSLTIPDAHYDGNAFYAGFICQRHNRLELFISSGRFNRHKRTDEGIMPLTDEQTVIIESYIALKLQRAYGWQNVVVYNTLPGLQDDEDCALFFSNTPFPTSKQARLLTPATILTALNLAKQALPLANIQQYIKATITPLKPKYSYPNEVGINPGFQDITSVIYPLQTDEKRIWVLRSDFILALGVKNAYQKEYNYHGLCDSFSPSLHRFLNWHDRYGHTSLTLVENDYDGSVFYAGYLCQRLGYLQVYLVSGRFERRDLTDNQTKLLEAYIAALLQISYGNQTIVFDYGDSDIPSFHATFFSNRAFASDNPQRCYDRVTINSIFNTFTKLSISNNSKEHTTQPLPETNLASFFVDKLCC